MVGYRELEAWTLHWQARSLDTSALVDPQHHVTQDDDEYARKGKQRHDQLAEQLKYRLPAVEVRSPAILPGGNRSSALASIAEASGVNGSGLAGAIIRFFGMLWPSPRQIQVRVWLEQTPDKAEDHFHEGHGRPPGPADRRETGDQHLGRQPARRCRLRGGRRRGPAHLRRRPHGPAVVHRRGGRQ